VTTGSLARGEGRWRDTGSECKDPEGCKASRDGVAVTVASCTASVACHMHVDSIRSWDRKPAGSSDFSSALDTVRTDHSRVQDLGVVGGLKKRERVSKGRNGFHSVSSKTGDGCRV